jgi:hypothetical protein
VGEEVDTRDEEETSETNEEGIRVNLGAAYKGGGNEGMTKRRS